MSNQQEWRTQSSLTNFPFVSGSSRTGTDRVSKVLESDIVDAHLSATDSSESGFHISSIGISDTSIEGVVSSSSGEVGTFSIQRGIASGGVANVIDENGIYRGLIVLGREGERPLFDSMPIGVVDFASDALEFHQSTIFCPARSRVATLSIDDITIHGRIRIKGGDGIRLELLREGSDSVVVIHAVGAQADNNCGAGHPIKNINSVPPSDHGTLFLKPAPYMTPEDATSLRQLLRIHPADDDSGIVVSLSELND